MSFRCTVVLRCSLSTKSQCLPSHALMCFSDALRSLATPHFEFSRLPPTFPGVCLFMSVIHVDKDEGVNKRYFQSRGDGFDVTTIKMVAHYMCEISACCKRRLGNAFYFSFDTSATEYGVSPKIMTHLYHQRY